MGEEMETKAVSNQVNLSPEQWRYARERFCSLMHQWANAYKTSLDGESEYMKKRRQEFRWHWDFVELQIDKSNLLYRTMIVGDELRTTPCPAHKGHWSGCGVDEDCPCYFHGNVTGWLPNNHTPEMAAKAEDVRARREKDISA